MLFEIYPVINKMFQKKKKKKNRILFSNSNFIKIVLIFVPTSYLHIRESVVN